MLVLEKWLTPGAYRLTWFDALIYDITVPVMYTRLPPRYSVLLLVFIFIRHYTILHSDLL